VIARALQGAGAAMAAPSVLALLTTSAPDAAARNRALALFGAVSSAGATIGLLVGGAVTDLGSWRWTLWINVPIGIAVLLSARRFVAETPRRPGRFDVVGAVTATLGAVAIVWSLIDAPEHGWLSVRTLGGLVVGLGLIALLARTELRHPHPLIQPHLVRNRARVAALATMALVIGANLSMFFLVVQYDERVLGLGPLATGAAFLPFSLSVFGMSRITPQLISWMGARTMIMVGSGSLVVAYLWLSQITASDSYFSAVFGPVLIAGLATGFIFMPITTTVLGGVEPEHAGSASGLLQTTQQLGSAVGVAVIVSIYATGAVPGQFVPGVQAAFLTSAGFSLAAFAVAAVGLRTRPAPQVAEELEPELADAA
jgi:MFS family permease